MCFYTKRCWLHFNRTKKKKSWNSTHAMHAIGYCTTFLPSVCVYSFFAACGIIQMTMCSSLFMSMIHLFGYRINTPADTQTQFNWSASVFCNELARDCGFEQNKYLHWFRYHLLQANPPPICLEMIERIPCFRVNNTIYPGHELCDVTKILRGLGERERRTIAKSQRKMLRSKVVENRMVHEILKVFSATKIYVESVSSPKHGTISISVRRKRMPLSRFGTYAYMSVHVCECVHISLWLVPLGHTKVVHVVQCNQIHFMHWTMHTQPKDIHFFCFIPQSEHHQTNKFSIHKTLPYYIFIYDGHCFTLRSISHWFLFVQQNQNIAWVFDLTRVDLVYEFVSVTIQNGRALRQ